MTTLLALSVLGWCVATMAMHSHEGSDGEPTNIWAVEIHGGDGKANELAERYCFENVPNNLNKMGVYQFKPSSMVWSYNCDKTLEERVSELEEDEAVVSVRRQYMKHMVPKKKQF